MPDRRGDTDLISRIVDMLENNLEAIHTSLDQLKETNQRLLILLTILLASIAGIDVSRTIVNGVNSVNIPKQLGDTNTLNDNAKQIKDANYGGNRLE